MTTVVNSIAVSPLKTVGGISLSGSGNIPVGGGVIRETQTASSGQTVFNLTNSYTPSTNSLSVYINGVRQFPTAFTETNSTTVTFTGPLGSGDIVLFEIGLIQSTVGASATSTTFNPITGNAATDVQTAITNITNGIGLTGFRNRIINGDMRVCQRPTSGTVASGAGIFVLDRYYYNNTGSSLTATVAQVVDSPTIAQCGVNSQYALQVSLSGAMTLASNTYNAILHRVEGYNIADAGFGKANPKQVTLSFWVKATQIGIYCIDFVNSANTRHYPIEYTINTSNTWEKKTVTFTADSTGTWLYDSGFGLNVYWYIATGSTYNVATPNVWGSTGWSTANQVNGFAASGNTFSLTLIQLEVASQASSFEQRPYVYELTLCESPDNTQGSGAIRGLNAYSLNGGQLAGFRNKLINGAFDVWQRGVSFVNPSSAYTADRWYQYSGAVATTIAPGDMSTYGYGNTNSLNCGVSSTTNTFQICQALDSVTTNQLKGKTVTFSIYMYSTSGASTVSLISYKNATANTMTGGSWTQIATTPITLSASIQRFTSTFTIPNDGTCNTLMVTVYGLNVPVSTYVMFNAQLEIGVIATPFEQRPYATELALCQRYYERAGEGSVAWGIYSGIATAASQYMYYGLTWAVQKRAAPTITKVGTWSASNSGQPSVVYPDIKGCQFYFLSTAAGPYYVQSLANCYIEANAELT